MGRLDDAAKQKVVELRKAGLSFRKIKAVLELENIKVSAQAIYLYLRELQGGPTGRVRPVEARGGTTIAQLQGGAGQIQANWNNARRKNPFFETAHHSGLTASGEVAKQPSLNPEACPKPPGYEETNRGSRAEQQHKGDKDEHFIQIVSVTSLAKNSQQNGPQASVNGAESGTGTSSSTSSEAFMRRRVMSSPANNSIWAARKRLLDKALSHRMKQSMTKGASLLRKDHVSVQDSSVRSAVPQRTDTYDLTSEKTVMENQRGEGAAPKRFLTQRPGLVLRSPYTSPRVGVRLPNRIPVPSPPAAPGGAITRLQAVGGQGATHSEKNPPGPPQTGQDLVGRGGLQDQIQTLGSEVRSLALAVKMLVEQQHRLEREQAEQTNIQKQILSTLQGLSTKLGQSSSSQTEHNKTPSPSALPTTSTSSAFNQGDFNFSQGRYAECVQTEAGYNSVDSLQSVEAFKLPRLSPLSMNGFSPCSKSETLPLTHTPPQSQGYVAAYAEQTLMHSCTQSYVSPYDQSHPQSFRISEDKPADYQSSCSATRTLQDCSGSTQTGLSLNHTGGQQLTNGIKAEGP